jgi:drug/metabolite transporter (DMT)-like permease
MTTIPRATTDDHAAATSAGTVYTLLAAVGFATVSTLTKIATGTHVSLWTVLMWRYVLASVVMVTFVGLRHYPRMPWREAIRLIIVGGGGQALFLGMALSAVTRQYVTVATLAFLFYTYPSWVTLVQAVRGAERITGRRAIALALSLAGIIVIAGAPTGEGNDLRGVALALGAAMVYGVYIPTMQWLQKQHPVAVTSGYAKIGSAICFLMLAISDQSFSVSLPSGAWMAIVALAIFSTVLPSVFFLMGLMRLGPVRTAIISTVEPFLTAILGAVVLGQAPGANTLAGGAVIVAAVVVLQYRRERVA